MRLTIKPFVKNTTILGLHTTNPEHILYTTKLLKSNFVTLTKKYQNSNQ